jgi:hypothetical protein
MADVSNKIEGKLVGAFISTNLVTPAWKEIVCGQDTGIDGSKNITTLETKCGTLKTAGPANWQLTGSGVANTTPDSDEISADDLIDIMQGSGQVLVKLVHATTAALYYRQGTGTMTAYSESGSVSDSITFDFTIEIDGNLDIVP